VGRHLPATVLTTDELMGSTRHRTGIDLERLTGIRSRQVSVGDEDSLSLALAAADDCLARSPDGADGIDLVLSCSISRYHGGLAQQFEPALAHTVADHVGADDALAFDVSNACAGTLTGVFVANDLIRQGAVRRALVVSGEYISQLGQNASRHVRNILSRELASLTLGDAGVALLLERAPDGAGTGVIEFAGFTTLADHSRLCLAYPGRREPGARMFTKARAIHRVAIAGTPPLLQEALAAAGRTLGDVDVVIPHQTSARAIRSGTKVVEEAFGESLRHPAVITVDRYGNTASTSHEVALVEELEAGRVQPGDRIALLALASGLEIGIVLFTADDELVRSHGNHD
jgi:3-oxoacyl-[acyl-carrier-protein] synthase-3